MSHKKYGNNISKSKRPVQHFIGISVQGMFGLFEKTDPESETHWQNIAITAFKYHFVLYTSSVNFILRLFDKNFDGYIDKKEFKWMTTSDIISNKTINIVFDVNKLISIILIY